MTAHDHKHGPDDGDHGHGHRHHGHSHGAGATDERRIGWAFVIIFMFMFVEAAGGLAAGSLALLADAGHMASDAAALGMSWAALRIGRRPADAQRSYGYQRIEVLVAYGNGCTLFVVAGSDRHRGALDEFAVPNVEVLGGTMLAVAVAGLLANTAAFFILHGGNRENLNMRSAWPHVVGDLLGSHRRDFRGWCYSVDRLVACRSDPVDSRRASDLEERCRDRAIFGAHLA